MDFNFTDKETLFIYGHFRKKIEELEALKNSPSCPIHEDTLNRDIELYSSISHKIEKCYPNLSKLNPFL